MRGIAGAYEREAIRPHVLGRFADMLLAVEKHPAMLVYLDNQVSVGPNSKAGVNRGLGLNENLAREILELHTLGVGGGYSQDDVTNLARILTGWTVGNLANPLTEPGKFFFAPPRHEPGEWTVLGKRYPDRGLQTGEDVLRALAAHPATARHIAAQARARISWPTSRRRRSLRAWRRPSSTPAAILRPSPRRWRRRARPGRRQPVKVLPPYDFLVAVVRGFALEPQARRAAAALRPARPAALAAAVAGRLARGRYDVGGAVRPARAAAHRRGGGAPGRSSAPIRARWPRTCSAMAWAAPPARPWRARRRASRASSC